ncbi:hypothetical protein PHLCEN_2v9635 [Hermanssonia centrifuga]|uniref:Uncharacterized protein n=1 Tax=Hermanssonia centrifuga TaxID=98765 RepID=A0A2R6NQ67_9APHY|nr:hypothetical protein PHLCEN_2v9635 [Hermanssonia centrifuga]
MATPSSSATTPSPRPRYLQTTAVLAPSASPSKDENLSVKEERERAVQKFLARAELSQLARGLRTRLSYVGFKATHNLLHNTLPDLEAQAQNHATSSRPSMTKPGNNHYNNPATQGNSAMAPTSSSKVSSRKGAMPPPPPVTASAAQSLYTSLLQPPPSKRARTIHNPQDPPVPASTKPKPSTPPRKTTKATRNAQSAQPKPKTRKDGKGKRREAGRGSGSTRSRVLPASSLESEGFANEEDDMKAAATLTSLLHSRPSISGTASSPRSSLSTGSDPGSSHSYSHYAQSSTRTTVPTPLQDNPYRLPYARATTPPRGRTSSLPQASSSRNTTPKTQGRPSTGRLLGQTTPHAPSDTEAADLMLFLATSPSPVRPTAVKDRDPTDSPGFRSLTGSSGLKGRVLFGSGNDDRGSPGGRPLRRDATGSFSSTTTEPNEPTGGQERLIGIPVTSSLLNPNHNRASANNSLQEISVIPPSTTTDQNVSQLLPPPASPSRTSRPQPAPNERPRSVPTPSDSTPAAPPTPGSVPFNLHEYINVSPSPATTAPPSKLNSLRADVGRKLFEEHHGIGSGGRENIPGHSSGLGAGIDLVKSTT